MYENHPKSDCVILKRKRVKKNHSSWIKPPSGWIKINFYGSVTLDGNSSIGFIIRNHIGQILSIHNQKIQNSSVIKTGALAALIWIQHAINLNYSNISLEGDNLTLIKAIKNIWQIPWEIRTIILDIRQLLSRFSNVFIFHYFRKANHAADLLDSKSTLQVNLPRLLHVIQYASLTDQNIRTTRRELCNIDSSSRLFFFSFL